MALLCPHRLSSALLLFPACFFKHALPGLPAFCLKTFPKWLEDHLAHVHVLQRTAGIASFHPSREMLDQQGIELMDEHQSLLLQ